MADHTLPDFVSATPSLAERAASWTFELVTVPSVNGTRDETAFAEWLRARLAALPIFAGTPEQVWTIPVADDPLGRASVAALVRGEGPRTVILTGHFDTVRIDDYGTLAPLATKPFELKPALIERLLSATPAPSAQLALADLQGGAFLPGRGLLDMKSGLAAGLAVLEAFGEDAQRAGNLLFIAVPDEEANSAGARHIAEVLPEIAARFGLSLDAAVNLDSLIDQGDGAIGRSVALGTIGKLLPSALVVGQAVHASNSLRGVNAGALAGAIARAVEWSPALTDRTDDDLAPPPTLLGIKDNRQSYDVTTPDRVWLYFNVMMHGRGPDEVLASFADLCRQAASEFRGKLAGRKSRLGVEDPDFPTEVPVLLFEELRRAVLADDPAQEQLLAERARELASRGLDMPEQCRLLTEQLWTASGRTGPAVVVGFGSMPYLPTALQGESGRRLQAAVARAVDMVGGRRGSLIGVCRTFPGISDMSYLGQVDPAAMPAVARNTPAWDSAVRLPLTSAGGIPIVNAGPWGRDYHTPLERLHTGYAFEVLPDLVLEIVRGVLGPDDPLGA